MESGRRLDALRLRDDSAASYFQAVVQGRHIGEGPVDERLIEQRPQMFGRPQLRRLRGRVDRVPPFADGERGAGMPERPVEYRHDTPPGPRARGLGE